MVSSDLSQQVEGKKTLVLGVDDVEGPFRYHVALMTGFTVLSLYRYLVVYRKEFVFLFDFTHLALFHVVEEHLHSAHLVEMDVLFSTLRRPNVKQLFTTK